MSDIIVTTHETLGNEHIATRSKAPITGNHVPYGLAGIVEGATVLCVECANARQLRDDEGEQSAIFGDSEWDYPGAICDDCEGYLDTNLLVYKSQDPKLYFRLRMSEYYSEYDTLLSIEEIAERAKEEAYALGWDEGDMMEGEYGEGGEYEGEHVEYPTDSAHFANNIDPKLREMSGFEDSKGGTYTVEPIDEAHWIYEEDTAQAFRNGYYDRLRGNEYEATLY